MWIKQIEIENFKSFFKPQVLKFEPGFNLILGANNSGKSSVLQALDMSHLPSVVHRSVANAHHADSPSLGHPRVTLTMAISAQELRRLQGQQTWFLPVREELLEELSGRERQACLSQLLEEKNLIVAIERGGTMRVQFSGVNIGTAWLSMGANEAITAIQVIEQPEGPIALTPVQRMGGISQQLAPALAHYGRSIYRFEASRVPAAIARLSASGTLLPNASNLASCVAHLGSNDSARHSQLCEWVQRVLPHVRWVQAPPCDDNNVELYCLPRPPAEHRNDLAVSLAQMGSGVGNVIAVLYVVVTARTPQVICIDEPNQYLHPKALRELLHILATEGRQHQYILTAHSADVITAVQASTVTMLSLREGATHVERTDRNGLAQLRDGFAELGIHATELHGRDRVLWVEGQTDELVFPDLLRHFCPTHAAGTAVLRVHDTGVFDKKGFDPIRASAIYTRLTEASALVPPMVAVVLDRETRKNTECKRLEADPRATLRFLPRRMLESFALHPRAIAAVLSDLGEPTDAGQVEKVLARAAGVATIGDIDSDKADAATLMKDAFNSISDTRHPFKKVRDVPALFRWLLAHDPDALKPLGDWLQCLLKVMPSRPMI